MFGFRKKACLSREVVDEYLRSLYHCLLKREPDNNGLRNWRTFLNEAGLRGFSQALSSFVESPEFKSLYAASSSENTLESFKEFDFSSLKIDVLDALFEKTSTYWRGIASAPEEIYWSVLTEDCYRGVLNEDAIRQFLGTGKGDVDRIKRICNEIDFQFDSCSQFLEYGCGVGRLVVNLPDSIKEINCVDFSAPHLAEAEANLRRAKHAAIYKMHKIDSIYDLYKLPKNQDIVHSLIVMQHNTPPIIENTVAALLGILSPGGIAILHIPIAKAFYKFDVAFYLGDEASGQSMEMHILPKANLYRLARKQSCEIVYSWCDGGCGGDIYSEIQVFRKTR